MKSYNPNRWEFSPRNILHIEIPVPVPELKTFTRWQVLRALFNPRAKFTTCESLQYQVAREAYLTNKMMVDKLILEQGKIKI